MSASHVLDNLPSNNRASNFNHKSTIMRFTLATTAVLVALVSAAPTADTCATFVDNVSPFVLSFHPFET